MATKENGTRPHIGRLTEEKSSSWIKGKYTQEVYKSESEEAATTEEGQPERTLTKKEERAEGVGGYVPRIGRSHDSHNQPWYSINNSDYS